MERLILRNAEELFVKRTGAKFYSNLFLRCAFYHMALTDNSRHLTVFLTHIGLFQDKVLPMGLGSTLSAWQRFMFDALSGCAVYMEDICVFGSTKEEYNENLCNVLAAPERLNPRLKTQKLRFHTTELTCFGHVVSSERVHTSIDNTAVIIHAPKPCTIPQVKRFSGLCSCYLNHVPFEFQVPRIS